MTENNSIITLPLKDYDAMRDEIASLKKQLEQKTIVIEVFPTWFSILVSTASILGFSAILSLAFR